MSEILQESPEKKAEWLKSAERRFPWSMRVRIVRSDVPAYVGQQGTVVGYDTGMKGDWPLISVRLDDGTIDGFYGDGDSEDEIVPCTT